MNARLAVAEVTPRVWVAVSTADFKRPHAADERAAGALPPWRARQFLAGRAVLRALLAEVCPDAVDAPISVGGRGKPELTERPEIGINISHDGEQTAACVGARRDVGVDVQNPPEPLSTAMLRRCAHGHLDNIIALTPALQATAFAWIWTVQEACVKAEGTGISGAPWSIDVSPGAVHGTWRGLHWRKLTGLCATPISCAWKEADR